MDDKTFQSLSKSQQDVVLKIAAEAERQGVNPKLAIAVAEAETGGKFTHYDKDGILTSPAGAQGLMQLLPSTVKLYNEKMNAGIDPENEDSNIKGGVFILKDLLTKYKSPRNAVNLYNASPKANATFLKLYETDPDAAILSLPKETRNYALRISKNFNLDDDKETGLIAPQGQEEQPKQDNPNNPFASGVPLADKIRESKGEEETTNKIPTTLLEKASELFNQVDPLYGAGLGAVANVAGAQSPLTSAEQANLSAQDKLELTRQALQKAAPQGVEDLQKSYAESQGELERIKNEQKLKEMQLKSIPPASPPPAPTPQEQFEIESRKISGAGAPYNTVQAFANERVPYSLASQAIDMTHNEGHGKGAHDIVDVFNQGAQKTANLGLSDYKLAGEKGLGELYLPPELADPKNAEIQQRTETTQNQQAVLAQQQEQERLRLQAELDQLKEQRASHGSQHNVLAGQVRDVKPLQRATTTAEINAEVAKRKAERAKQNPITTPQDLLNKGKTVGRTVAGGAAGYYGVMSLQEALERFKNGDTSEGVMQTLGAVSAGASLVPPVNPKLSALKKAGALGALGMGGREIYRRFTQEPPAQ